MLAEEIKDFLENAGPIFFVTPSPARAIGLEKILPDFHIICSDPSDVVSMMRESGVKVLRVEGEGLINAGKILRSSEALNYIRKNSTGRIANIITFKSSPMISKVCEDNGFRYLGSDWRLNRRWEDKIFFAEKTNELGLKNADSRILIAGENFPFQDFDFSCVGKYVVQFSRGYSGNSSFLVSSEDELRQVVLFHKGRKVKISRYIQGDSYTLDACIGKFGSVLSCPIFQITGFSEFNKNALGTCGNDYAYAKNLSSQAVESIDLTIAKILEKMKEDGYLGVVGFDFVIDGDEAHVIEVNPRLVGSIPVFTKLQIAADDFPLLLLHILSFLGYNFQDFEIQDIKRQFDFSQVVFRNISGGDIRVEKVPKTGIYEFNSGDLHMLKTTYCVDEIMDKSQFFIQTIGEGSTVAPNMEYANIQFACGIMKDKGVFSERFNEIKGAIFKEIILK